MPNRSPGEPPATGESPAIPSFASLRDPRRRTAVDLLTAGPAGVAPPVPHAARAMAAAPRQGGPAPRHAGTTRQAGAAPRPAEYADLLRFGVRVVRAAAVLPVRVVGWSVRKPVRCLRRLAG